MMMDVDPAVDNDDNIDVLIDIEESSVEFEKFRLRNLLGLLGLSGLSGLAGGAGAASSSLSLVSIATCSGFGSAPVLLRVSRREADAEEEEEEDEEEDEELRRLLLELLLALALLELAVSHARRAACTRSRSTFSKVALRSKEMFASMTRSALLAPSRRSQHQSLLFLAFASTVLPI